MADRRLPVFLTSRWRWPLERLLPVVLAAGGLMFAAVAIQGGMTAWDAQRRYRPAMAEVVELVTHSQQDRRGTTRTIAPRYRFTAADGTVVRAEAMPEFPSPATRAVGDRVPILYDPVDPGRLLPAEAAGLVHATLQPGLLAAVCLLGAAMAWRWSRRRRQARQLAHG